MADPLDVFDRRPYPDLGSLIWDDDLEGGEWHAVDCAKVLSQRRLMREHGSGVYETRDELVELMRRRDPCDCPRREE